MKIERICFEQLYPTGIYANQRYRAEASVYEGEILTECYKQLQQEVEKAFVAMNPQIKWQEIKQPAEINKEAERIEIAIDNCTSPEDLKSLENDALKYGLIKQYLDKKKELA